MFGITVPEEKFSLTFNWLLLVNHIEGTVRDVGDVAMFMICSSIAKWHIEEAFYSDQRLEVQA